MKLTLGDNEYLIINGVRINGVEFNAAFPHTKKTKPKKEVHPKVAELRSIYEVARPDYYWSAKDYIAINKIIGIIEFAYNSVNKRPPREDEYAKALSYVLTNLPEWYKLNDWTPSTIAANFNSIVDTIKKAKEAQKNQSKPISIKNLN